MHYATNSTVGINYFKCFKTTKERDDWVNNAPLGYDGIREKVNKCDIIFKGNIPICVK